MTPLPKRRLSHKRQGKRRASFNLKVAALELCPNCQKSKLPHKACPSCGYYKGEATRPVVAVKSPTGK